MCSIAEDDGVLGMELMTLDTFSCNQYKESHKTYWRVIITRNITSKLCSWLANTTTVEEKEY